MDSQLFASASTRANHGRGSGINVFETLPVPFDTIAILGCFSKLLTKSKEFIFHVLTKLCVYVHHCL